MMTLLFANSIMIINISVQANDFTVWLNEEFDAFLVGETVTFIVVLLYIYALKWSQIYKAQTMNQSKVFFCFFFRKNMSYFNLQYYCDAAISCTCSASVGALVF